jgi:aconitate hydratase
MGVLPLQFLGGQTRQSLKLDGTETFDVVGIAHEIKPRMAVELCIRRANGTVDKATLLCRIDTADEVEYYRHGGILSYVLRNLRAA